MAGASFLEQGEGAQDCCTQCPWPHIPGYCWTISLPETPKHTQANLAQSLVGSLLLSPGSYMHKILFVPSNSFCFSSPWKFCNQILLTFRVRFSGDTQSLFQIPTLGSLLCGLELLHQQENFFSITVLQFVSCPPPPALAPPWWLYSGANSDFL